MVKYYRNTGISLLQTKNIKNFFIEDDEAIKITPQFHSQLIKSQVHHKNILIARSGSFGKASIYLEDKAINSSDIIIVEADENKINPYFLVAFLNSKFGTNQMIRFSSGGLQGHVNLTILEELEVPMLNKEFQQNLEKILISSYSKAKASKKTYIQAEQLLLSEIGLQNFTPSTEAVNIKSFADSFATSGRLDAEYYQPKYEQIVTQIEQQQHDHLDNLVTIKKSIEPGSKYYTDEGLAFLRVADYSKQGLTEPQKYLSDEFIQENAEKIALLKPKKDTILFSKDGSVGTAYQLREDFNGITSGAILHLNIKNEEKLLPEYLTLVLNSELVQLQAERDAGGSIILHWRVGEIESVVIPIISLEKQQQIADLVEQSFALKQQSEHLLKVAKRAVEIAIEESEDVAMAYIESEVATNE